MTNRSRELTVLAIAATSLVVLYFDVLVKLVDAWTNDGNYSHGFLIVPLAGYFAWERRDRLSRAVANQASSASSSSSEAWPCWSSGFWGPSCS